MKLVSTGDIPPSFILNLPINRSVKLQYHHLMQEQHTRLVLIGNGFDLAHGLKTTYRDFLDWYMCSCYNEFYSKSSYSDRLILMKHNQSNVGPRYENSPENLEEVIFRMNHIQTSLSYPSDFFGVLIKKFQSGSWVNIERQYFQELKGIFANRPYGHKFGHQAAAELNTEFGYMIKRLTEYFVYVNSIIGSQMKLPISKTNLKDVFKSDALNPVRFVNFNYTDTLSIHRYANEDQIVHIHGRASRINVNPIIFGYGDETDPGYQNIEDSGDNVYLDHIKSFGYFKTDNYSKLISLIESGPYVIYIIGHSCGISDRILLSELFEHKNCEKIEIFYHRRKDNTDNFKEITQEISRHFKPQNKGLMRRRLGFKNDRNALPQVE